MNQSTTAIPHDRRIDTAEFNPNCEVPDVVFCHLEPGFSKGDVEMMLSVAASGTHVVVLGHTDKWSEAIALRLGFSYGGLLDSPPARDLIFARPLTNKRGVW